MARKFFWNGNWHTVPNPYGGSGMFAGVRVTPPPPPPTAQAQPLDPVADQRRILIQQQLGNTQADINQQEQDVKRQYGLDDPTDPFSRAALLRQSYQNRVRGTTNSYAANGQLYAGSEQNAQNSNATNFTQGQDALRKAQDGQIANLERQRTQAIFNAASGNLDATQQSLSDNLANPPDPSTLPVNALLGPQPIKTSMPKLKLKRKKGK